MTGARAIAAGIRAYLRSVAWGLHSARPSAAQPGNSHSDWVHETEAGQL